ncbi:secreted protein [gut metagenome]|uniref:Secreted protein n=1 Tax=gut metagenome TaxID=749906 RepID=J9CN96_9ZZZZ
MSDPVTWKHYLFFRLLSLNLLFAPSFLLSMIVCATSALLS